MSVVPNMKKKATLLSMRAAYKLGVKATAAVLFISCRGGDTARTKNPVLHVQYKATSHCLFRSLLAAFANTSELRSSYIVHCCFDRNRHGTRIKVRRLKRDGHISYIAPSLMRRREKLNRAARAT